MSNITVTIPNQTYNLKVYMGSPHSCYLEQALVKAGYKDVVVSGWGCSKINGVSYKPVNAFDGDIVERAFDAGEDIIVELRKSYN